MTKNISPNRHNRYIKMKKAVLCVAIAATMAPFSAYATPLSSTKMWSFTNASITGQTSEISAFDSQTNTLWVAGVKGVDVINARTGSLVQHISTTSFGSINSVAINNGIAAFAIESPTRTNAGVVKLYDTATRNLSSGVNSINVGALPDMLTFTPDGKSLLVANEGTPNLSDYGTRIGTTVPRSYGAPILDPVGSVSIIDMLSRSVVATPTLAGVLQTGTNIRTNTGMDFEPEYIAVNANGTKAFVGLQEANAIGILDLQSRSFEKVVGLGTKDFNQVGNEIDPLNNGTVTFGNHNAKGLFMPDGLATFERNGKTFIVMANEGDFREDDGDRSAASSVGAISPLNNLRISNTDSSTGNLYSAGARSFSIRDAEGNLVYDSGSILDKEAHARGIYDDGRSRDKGVEPEGVEIMEIGGKTYAFVGLERTTKSAVAVFDITDMEQVGFIDMIVTEQDLRPEGLEGFTMDGKYFLAITNEGNDNGGGVGTTLYQLSTVPEPESLALLFAGLAALRISRRKTKPAQA
jgi:DNA-binding beta-propeller fold protein YncE